VVPVERAFPGRRGCRTAVANRIAKVLTVRLWEVLVLTGVDAVATGALSGVAPLRDVWSAIGESGRAPVPKIANNATVAPAMTLSSAALFISATYFLSAQAEKVLAKRSAGGSGGCTPSS
jgi:hypothetical protein